MRAICRQNTGCGLSDAALKAGHTRESLYRLKVGQAYPVYAQMLSQGVLYFLIVDSDTSIASFNPAELFDLSDSSIPASWKFGSYDDDQDGIRMIWGYPLLVEDEAHAGALEDRDVNAISAFLQAKSKIDQEYGVPA